MSESEGIDPAALEVVEAQEEVLSSFDLDGQDVSFLLSHTGDSPTSASAHVVLQVLARDGDPDYLAAIQAREGELTMLEWFNALAPAELSPPAALIESHELEAERLGRSDGSVKPVTHVDLLDPEVDKQVVLCNTFQAPFSKPVTPKLPPFVASTQFICMGGKSGTSLLPPNVNSCDQTFTVLLRTGACVPTFRGLLTPQSGTATFRDGHETVLNGVHSFTLSSPVTLNVGNSLTRLHRSAGSNSHTVLSAVSSNSDNLEIIIQASLVL